MGGRAVATRLATLAIAPPRSGAARGERRLPRAPPPRVASRTLGAPRKSPTGIDKIRHVVVIMQENRFFDHHFGTLRDADGIPLVNGRLTVCAPASQRAAASPRSAIRRQPNQQRPRAAQLALRDRSDPARSDSECARS